MDVLVRQVTDYLSRSGKYQWVERSSVNHSLHCESLISHFNPARPSLIQVVGPQEAEYLSTLSRFALMQQLQVFDLRVSFVIFAGVPVVSTFGGLLSFNVLQTELSASEVISELGQQFSCAFGPAEIQQGAFVVVENRGFILSGRSGAGKSRLLLGLLDRGHHWVADELTRCYVNHSGEIYGTFVEELSAYVHIKQVGPVNLDKTYGLGQRLKRFPLAGFIHLKENNEEQNPSLPSYEQKLSKKVLGRSFPFWLVGPEVHNLEIIIETCARQLSLSEWGFEADRELQQELEKTLFETT